MRLSVRAVAISLATVLGLGAVAVSVSASAVEPLPAITHVAAAKVTPAEVELAAGTRTTFYLELERASVVRTAVAAAAKARTDAVAAHNAKIRARVISVAKKQLGDRYSAGSAGPSAFDCSGFTLYVYRVAAGKNLPHYSGAQYRKVKKISLRLARPGDLVFFLRHGAHHVGIYLGHGRMIDAAGYGKGVRISPISGSWWGRSFTGIGRLLPA